MKKSEKKKVKADTSICFMHKGPTAKLRDTETREIVGEAPMFSFDINHEGKLVHRINVCAACLGNCTTIFLQAMNEDPSIGIFAGIKFAEQESATGLIDPQTGKRFKAH